MALKKTIEMKNGLIVSDAYIRIDSISGFKGGLDISVNSYVSKEAFEIFQGYLEQNTHHFVPSVEDGSLNFIKQGYDHLKTLPEYADAIDV